MGWTNEKIVFFGNKAWRGDETHIGEGKLLPGVEISYIASCTRREEETHLAEQRKE